MNKKLIILIVLLALAVGTFLFLGKILGHAVKTAVNSFAPQVTGTTVTLGSAMISPLSGSGSLHDFYVGNPEGFSDGKAFSCGKVHVDVKVTSVLGDTIDIEEVLIEAPEFVYETKLTSSNIGRILDNVNSFTGPSEKTASDSPGKKIIIRRFVLEKAVVAVSAGGVTVPVPVPRLEIVDVGTAEGGVYPSEAVAQVLKQVLGSVSKAAVTAIANNPDLLGKDAGGAVRKIGEGVKGLFDKVTPKP